MNPLSLTPILGVLIVVTVVSCNNSLRGSVYQSMFLPSKSLSPSMSNLFKTTEYLSHLPSALTTPKPLIPPLSTLLSHPYYHRTLSAFSQLLPSTSATFKHKLSYNQHTKETSNIDSTKTDNTIDGIICLYDLVYAGQHMFSTAMKYLYHYLSLSQDPSATLSHRSHDERRLLSSLLTPVPQQPIADILLVRVNPFTRPGMKNKNMEEIPFNEMNLSTAERKQLWEQYVLERKYQQKREKMERWNRKADIEHGDINKGGGGLRTNQGIPPPIAGQQ